MCGSVPSGPVLILLFPLILGGSAYNFIHSTFSSMDSKIRENNQKIDSNWKIKRRELKEKILYRKQDKAEKMLNNKMKIVDGDDAKLITADEKNENSASMENSSDPKVVLSSEDAILYLQRTLVRCASNKYEKAMNDLKFAVYLDYTLKETYIVKYLEGFLLYVTGDYLESAHAFKKAIELKEANDSKSNEVEKKVFEIQNVMKHTAEKVMENLNEFHEQTKSYFKHAGNLIKSKLGKQVQEVTTPQEEQTEKVKIPSSIISLEELYFRAGISYYFSTYYRDSIECYNKAIEIGKDHPNLGHYIYNRGLSYYYSHEVDLALDDFLQSMSIINSDECAKMIAYVYGRKDMKKERDVYIQKAKALNPNTKIISAFSYRLLDDNSTELIFSFLPVYNRILISRTCKYWREIAMKSVVNDDILEISFRNLINNADRQLEKHNHTSSLKEKLFMPSHERVNGMQILGHTLNSSFFNYYLKKPGKRTVYYMMQPLTYGSEHFYIENRDVEKALLTDVESINTSHGAISGRVIRNLAKRSPNLKELIIRTNTYAQNDMDIVKSIKKFRQLKKLVWHFNFSDSSDFVQDIYPKLDLPPSLEYFEYDSNNSELFSKYIIPHHPRIKFVPKDNTVEVAQSYREVITEN